MTLEEAKKILEKEGFKLGGPGKPGVVSEAFAEYEAPEICEAMQIVCSAGFQLAMLAGVFDERKERLKKEYEKNTKAPDSVKNCIKEDSVVINPALKESATQFNDALLDEQAKKIKRLGKEIARLNGIIHDKNAILADVAEELRLSKIREKNLTEVCQKYMKENEDLKEKLANKVVDKIDAQALKSAESALAWKEKLIADLGKELTESKKRVEWVRNASKEYCDYGVAANEFIKELAGLYVLANNNGIINDEMLERCKNYQTYGFPANCNRETKKEIDDIARGNKNKKPRIPTPEEPKHGNSREDFIKKTIDSFNRRAANLGCFGSKDGNGIIDQMIGIDNAEEGGDHSAKVVLCGKDFCKILKENEEFVFDFFKRHKETAEELHEVADEALEQLLLFGEIIIKSEK